MPASPHEVLPGVWHWRAYHERIQQDVSSWYLPEVHVAIDPKLPEEGVAWFTERGGVADVLLSCRHHYRDASDLVEAFGSTVRGPRSGLHEFTDGPQVEGYDPGDELPGGVIAREVDAISPDETALHLPTHRAILIADGVVQWEPGGPLAFVPDFLMGDDPQEVKTGLTAAFERLLELDFDHLLLAHGEPLVGDGKAQLRTFVSEQSGD
jgi:hypothetical protein